MVETCPNINTNLIAELKLAAEELICPKTGRRLEFVCTKKESKLCLDRLCCSKCIITDFSDHFQWMTVLEDFFLPNPPKTQSDMKPLEFKEIENFIENSQEKIAEFEQKVDNDSKFVNEQLSNLKQKVNKELDKLLNSVVTQRDSFFKEFYGNYEELDKALNPPKDTTEELVISDMKQLQEFLEQRVKFENDKQEMKIERVFESLNDDINCLSLIQSDEKKGSEILKTLDKLVSFGTLVERFNFFKKNSQPSLSNLNFNDLVCTKTLNPANKKISKMALINSEKQIAICSDDETITIWERATGQLIQTLTGHTERTLTVTQLRDGSLASGGCDNKIKIWNVTKGTLEQELSGHTGHIASLIELPQMTLLSGAKDKTVRFWDLKNKDKPLKSTLQVSNQHKVFCMTLLSHDLFAASSEKEINIIGFDDLAIKKTLTGHTGIVRDLILFEREDLNVLISCSEDKSIRLWNLTNYDCLLTLSEHKSPVIKVLVFSKGVFVTAGEDGALKFWNGSATESLKTIAAHTQAVTDITLTKDGSLITCGNDKIIKLWTNQNP